MTSRFIARAKKKFNVSESQIMEVICYSRSKNVPYDDIADYVNLYMTNEDLHSFITSFPCQRLSYDGIVEKSGCFIIGSNAYFPSEKYKAKFLLKHGPF